MAGADGGGGDAAWTLHVDDAPASEVAFNGARRFLLDLSPGSVGYRGKLPRYPTLPGLRSRRKRRAPLNATSLAGASSTCRVQAASPPPPSAPAICVMSRRRTTESLHDSARSKR